MEEEPIFIVIVIFEPPADDVQANEDAVRQALDTLVSKQPGFLRARLHRGTGSTPDMVVNYMEWRDADAFHAFRERHGAQIGELVGRFDPRFTFHEVAHGVSGTG